MNPLTNKETISSLEIAEMAGKPHSDLMKSIRKMEESWKKVNEGNFSLVEYKDKKGQSRPMYQLTKTECLYIASKFNDETRAKLVLRWEQLEKEKHQSPPIDFSDPNVVVQLAQNFADEHNKRLEAEAREAKAIETIELQEAELKESAPKVEMYDKVMDTQTAIPTTILAKDCGISAVRLNKMLKELGVQYYINGTWVLKSKYQGKGYTDTRTHIYYDRSGHQQTKVSTLWTMAGREFIYRLVGEHYNIGPLASKAS